MKKLSLKSKILLGAFLLGSGSAVAQEIVGRVAKANQQQYQWQRYDRETQQPTGEPFVDTEANVRDTYNCFDETTDVCAEGTSSAGSLTIYYNN